VHKHLVTEQACFLASYAFASCNHCCSVNIWATAAKSAMSSPAGSPEKSSSATATLTRRHSFENGNNLNSKKPPAPRRSERPAVLSLRPTEQRNYITGKHLYCAAFKCSDICCAIVLYNVGGLRQLYRTALKHYCRRALTTAIAPVDCSVAYKLVNSVYACCMH
jgi:hypothetical protein